MIFVPERLHRAMRAHMRNICLQMQIGKHVPRILKSQIKFLDRKLKKETVAFLKVLNICLIKRLLAAPLGSGLTHVILLYSTS